MNDKNLEQNLNPVEQPGVLFVEKTHPTPKQEIKERDEGAVRENKTEQPTEEQTTPARRRPIRSFRPLGPIASPARDEVTLRIEKIMEDGIGDAYQRLSPIARQEFKLKGEQTALKIRELLRSSHVKVKKIFQLILEWLKMLPGVNRFFLEQEAKIKADHIITLHKKQHGQT